MKHASSARKMAGKFLAGDSAQFAAVHHLERSCMFCASSIAPATLLSIITRISAALWDVSVWR
jgi:hypothetical protein